MLTSDLLDWVESLGVGEHFNVGSYDTRRDKTVFLFERKTSTPELVPLGGYMAKSYDVKRVSILVHWNNNFRDTELAAEELHKKILEEAGKCGEEDKPTIIVASDGMIDLYKDANGVYERKIDLDIYFKL